MQLVKEISLFLLLSVTLMYSCKVRTNRLTVVPSNGIDSIVQEQRLLLKEYALCECLRYGYKDSKVYEDISTAIYYNELLYGQDVIDSMYVITERYVKGIPASDHIDYDKQKPVIAACIQWYKSTELDSFVKSQDKWLNIWIDRK